MKTVKYMADRTPVHTETAHFLSANFENGRSNKRNSNCHILEMGSFVVRTLEMMKTKHFSTLSVLNEIDRFQEFGYVSLASKSCNEFLIPS